MNLYPYQTEGAEWLATKDRALLADEPGLGKTGQAVVAADIIRAKDILIIPPAAARSVWHAEVEKWSFWGHDINVMKSGEDKPRRNAVNVINYDLLGRHGFQLKDANGKKVAGFKFTPWMKQFLAWDWDLVVADEAHYLKERDSLRTRTILENRGINGRAKRMWFLTGTPMPNHPAELWPIMCACGATELDYQKFVDTYCITGKTGFDANKIFGAKPEMTKELNQLLRSIMKRRYKSFVMPQLPPIRIDDTPVPECKINLEEFFTEATYDPSGIKKKIKAQEDFIREVHAHGLASAGQMSTMQMVNLLENVGPAVALYRRWLGAVKVQAFLPILTDELENNGIKKVIIFCHHKQVIAAVMRRLEKFGPVKLDGSTGYSEREKAVHDFQFDDNCRVFVGQTIAAGTALTLTAAHEVVVLEPDWTPANNAQAIMRAHRIGQKNAVRARFIRLAGTLDDYITATLARKTNDIVKIVDAA